MKPRSASRGLGHFPGLQKESSCQERSRFGATGFGPSLLPCQGVIGGALSGPSPGPPALWGVLVPGPARGWLFGSQKVQASGGGAPEPLASGWDRLRIWGEGCWGQ